MKREKVKPRSYDKYLNKCIFNCYNRETKIETEDFIRKSEDTPNVNFHLFQAIDGKYKRQEELLKIAYFYDRNYIGNKDFIEIPNLKQIIYNVRNYPVIVASNINEKGIEELLGVTCIKFENNKNINDNPYFPTKNENVLSITGILTKLNTLNGENRVRNIGKTLFKAGIKGAYDINKEENVRLICKIDCRNKNSFYGVCKAVKDLQNSNMDIQIFIDGYYEILNSDKRLIEAPTFILEIDLNGNKNINNEYTKFSYSKYDEKHLLQQLKEVIENNTKEQRRYVNSDKEKTIIYHKIHHINALNVELDVKNTADGNLRTPVLPILMEPIWTNTKL